MIVKATHKGIYERILSDKNGQLIRVCFAVVEINGALKGQIISIEPVLQVTGKTLSTHTTPHVCLPISIQNDISDTTGFNAYSNTPSPYSFLDFFNSQPTRAPSFL